MTNLGVFDFATDDHRMRLRTVHPGVTVEEVQEATGFELVIDDDPGRDPAAHRRGADADPRRARPAGPPGGRDPVLTMAHPALHTALCDLVGVRYPIVQTGMGWVAGPRLVSATANAGGLGILAAATMDFDQLAVGHRRGQDDAPTPPSA